MKVEMQEENLINPINDYKHFWLLVAIILSYTLSFVAIIVFPQETGAKTVVAFSFLLLGIALIFAFSSKQIIDQYGFLVSRNKPAYVAISFASIILPFLLVVFTGDDIAKSFVMFLLWYCIPVIMLVLGETVFSKSDKNSFFKIIIGVAMLWIGMDHRYTMVIFDGLQNLSYNLTTIWIVNILLICYSPLNLQYHEKVSSKVTLKGIKWALIFVPILLVLITPFGLLSGFLIWNPDVSTNPLLKIGTFIAIYLTIALPEEFIFRGVILNEFDKRIGEKSHFRWLTLVFVSFIFGSTHWNNTSSEFIFYYILFASIAGIAYGYTWRKAGLFGAALLHTTVDWVWLYYLQ